MNTTIWILQGTVAAALIASGLIIMLLPKEKLAQKLTWVSAYSDGMRFFICSSKILGGIGLILPQYLKILPVLTPVSACFIALFMLFAMRYHVLHKEYKDIPATVVFLILSLMIAYFRF